MMSFGKKRAIAAVAASVAGIALAACSAGGGPSNSGSDAGGAKPSAVRVFAAASLKDPFEQLAQDFEKSHPDVSVELNFAGSQDLVSQMEAGAPADVFASASPKWMDAADEAGLISGDSKLFASNTLTIAVAPGNPEKIDGLDSLADRPDLVTVRCAPEVPCGALADKVLKAADEEVSFDTEQNSVTDTLGLVTSGEADAALVYASDVATSGGKAEAVDIPEAANIPTTYPIAVTKQGDAEATEASADFMALVLSPEGQRVLGESGLASANE